MQARYYDPVIGRFYSNDPVDFIGHLKRGNNPAHGFGRYSYANNNPYKYVDPDGMFSMPPNFGDFMENNEGAQLATQKLDLVKNAATQNLQNLTDNLNEGADTIGVVANKAFSVSPGGAKVKLTIAVGQAVIKAYQSDTPLKTFGIEMASEALGKGIGDKIGKYSKAVPDLFGLSSATNNTIKEVAGNVASDAAKKAIKDEFVEKE